MAGSWGHMVVNGHKVWDGDTEIPPEYRYTAEDIGKPYRDPETMSFPLVENMGDAVEALEECYGMVWYLAQQLGICLDGDSDQGPEDRARALTLIEEAREHYQDGYRLGAGVDPSW